MGTVERIEAALRAGLSPESLRIEDESHLHAGHAGAAGGGGHYAVTVVAAAFEGMPPVARHRAVYALLGEEMRGAIHALAITAIAPSERR